MKLDASSCRGMAWERLQGRWWNALMTGLVASFLGVFTGLFSGVLKLVIFTGIIMHFCEGVPFYRELTFVAVLVILLLWVYVGSFVRFGYIDYNLAILDQRKVRTELIFGAGSQWFYSIAIRWILVIGTAIGCLFFVVPGLIFYYSYAMTPFLLEEMEDISLREAMRLSRERMRGYRGELFFLHIGFAGWFILSILTLGIGFLWLHPYISLSETVFFNEVSGRAREVYGREK